MSGSLTIIKEVLAEHQTIRQHVKPVGESMSGDEALISLGEARADWFSVTID